MSRAWLALGLIGFALATGWASARRVPLPVAAAPDDEQVHRQARAYQDPLAKSPLCHLIDTGMLGHVMAPGTGSAHLIQSAKDYSRSIRYAAFRSPDPFILAPKNQPLVTTGRSIASAFTDWERRILLPLLLRGADRFAAPVPVVVAPVPAPTTVLAPVPTTLPAPLPTATSAPSPPELVTYYQDVKPIFERRCTSCHYANGVAPFPLTSYGDAKTHALVVGAVVGDKYMPPLPADPDSCTPFTDPRNMPQAERDLLVAWVAGGAAEGDPERAISEPPVPDPFGAPSDRIDIGVNYEPGVVKETDNYRCFVIDPGFKTDTSIRMADIVPTNTRLYHHGILFLAPPNLAAAIQKLDRDDPGPGYSCFGGPGIPTADWLVAEAPGAPRLPYPDGSARLIPAGSKFVLQLHYNMLNTRTGTDRSAVELWRAKGPVAKEPRDLILVNTGFSIPPGAKAYSAQATGRIVGANEPRRALFQEKEGLIWGAALHMHLLGAHIRMDLLRADGSKECLLNIPDWNFNWQGSYMFTKPVPAKAGDRVQLTCTWDNSPENQPVVDGVRQTPRTVTWGERTLDEMCLGGVTLVDP